MSNALFNLQSREIAFIYVIFMSIFHIHYSSLHNTEEYSHRLHVVITSNLVAPFTNMV